MIEKTKQHFINFGAKTFDNITDMIDYKSTNHIQLKLSQKNTRKIQGEFIRWGSIYHDVKLQIKIIYI